MEYVQVVKQDLLTYIAYVEQLVEHHDKLEQTHKDLIDLQAIEQATQQVRLSALTDYILDNNSNSEYTQGLIDAYNLIRQGKVSNG